MIFIFDTVDRDYCTGDEKNLWSPNKKKAKKFLTLDSAFLELEDCDQSALMRGRLVVIDTVKHRKYYAYPR